MDRHYGTCTGQDYISCTHLLRFPISDVLLADDVVVDGLANKSSWQYSITVNSMLRNMLEWSLARKGGDQRTPGPVCM